MSLPLCYWHLLSDSLQEVFWISITRKPVHESPRISNFREKKYRCRIMFERIICWFSGILYVFFKISDPTQLCSKHLLTRDWALVEPHNSYFKTFFLFVRCVAARLGWYQKVACNASISYPRTKDTLLQNVKTKKSFLLPPLLLRSRGSSKTIIVFSRLAVM